VSCRGLTFSPLLQQIIYLQRRSESYIFLKAAPFVRTRTAHIPASSCAKRQSPRWWWLRIKSPRAWILKIVSKWGYCIPVLVSEWNVWITEETHRSRECPLPLLFRSNTYTTNAATTAALLILVGKDSGEILNAFNVNRRIDSWECGEHGY